MTTGPALVRAPAVRAVSSDRVAASTRLWTPRWTRVLVALLAATGLALAAWEVRAAPLRWLGDLLVHEDALRPADVAIVSVASVRGTALDAAKLFRRGLVREVWVMRWRADRVDRVLAARGLAVPPPHEVARHILEGAGVPASDIVVLDTPVEGLESEMAVIGNALQMRPGTRLIVLTARSHTARARFLLLDRREADVQVRAPHSDEFMPTGWWRDHGAGRELVTEYLKWAKLLATGPSEQPRVPDRAVQ